MDDAVLQEFWKIKTKRWNRPIDKKQNTEDLVDADTTACHVYTVQGSRLLGSDVKNQIPLAFH